MANQEHLAVLKEGVEVWNKWREENPDVWPDLKGANLTDWMEVFGIVGLNLRGVNLNRADLSKSNLRRADLRGANLRGAYLEEANLWAAKLTGADLAGADISWTVLAEANFSKCDLSGANLKVANLTRAYLYGANLAKAHLHATVFGDTHLSTAKGLDQCVHGGPSIIDMRTLQRSWPLPLPFLRGCGLGDTFIEYLPSLIGQAIQFYSCFISYSSDNDDFARRLHDDLQESGVRCWFAPEDLKIGDRLRPAIDDAIRLHDKLLLILSEHSVESQWVEGEVETALEKERKLKADGHPETVLFPIRLDEAVMETDEAWASLIRKTRHIGDFCSWDNEDNYRGAFERLLRDLRAS